MTTWLLPPSRDPASDTMMMMWHCVTCVDREGLKTFFFTFFWHFETHSKVIRREGRVDLSGYLCSGENGRSLLSFCISWNSLVQAFRRQSLHHHVWPVVESWVCQEGEPTLFLVREAHALGGGESLLPVQERFGSAREARRGGEASFGREA